MDKLNRLFETMATALNVPAGAVLTRWTVLRKAKMWTPGLRGRPRPEPVASDIVTLLLAFLGGGHANDAPATVRLLRSSAVVTHWHPTLAELPFDAETSLGDMLDMLIARWVDVSDADVELRVRRTWAGYSTNVTVTRTGPDHGIWGGSYSATDPAVAAVLAKDQPEAIKRWLFGPIADVITERSVSHRTLGALAVVLKGGSREDAEIALSKTTKTELQPENVLASPGTYVDVHSGTLTVVQPDRLGRAERKAYERAVARAEKRRRRR